MQFNVINTREDLDLLIGSAEHQKFMLYLKGSMSQKRDVQEYPAGYGSPGYEGPLLTPIWQDFEDLSVIERFNFAPSDFDLIF